MGTSLRVEVGTGSLRRIDDPSPLVAGSPSVTDLPHREAGRRDLACRLAVARREQATEALRRHLAGTDVDQRAGDRADHLVAEGGGAISKRSSGTSVRRRPSPPRARRAPGAARPRPRRIWGAGRTMRVVLAANVPRRLVHRSHIERRAEIGVDPARADRVDQHVVLAEFGRERLGEIEQRGIGHAAAEHVRVRLLAGAADRVDDAAPLLRLHHRIDQPDRAHEAEQLGLELVLQLVVVEHREAAGIHRAGIVDENVDAAELLASRSRPCA